MKGKGIFPLLLLLIVPLLWNAAFVQWSINTRESKSLSSAVIPESTLAFLDSLANRLVNGFDHLHLTRVDTLDMDSWNNDHDYGRREEDGFYVYEPDSLFVIYSDRADEEMVRKTHQFALEAIPEMKELMGRYVYPHMMNGRKLPLYLCFDEDVYQKASRSLCGGNGDYSQTWGLCVYRYSGVTVQTQGITLNFGSMRRVSPHPELDLKATIWHEMNHYVYFQSINLGNEISMHTWMYEGLAEYFASRVKQQVGELHGEERAAVDKNHLDMTFVPFPFNYSGGEIFYKYLEYAKGKDAVCDFIQNIYTKDLGLSLADLGMNISAAENGWRNYLMKNYI